MMKNVFVLFVKRLLWLINIPAQKPAVRVVGVKHLVGHTESKVYNLSVAEAKCYYVNKVLVHNCDAVQYLCLGARYGYVPTKKSADKPAKKFLLV